MAHVKANRLPFLILGGSREQFDFWNLFLKFNYCDTPWLKPFNHRNHSCILYLPLFAFPSTALSILGLVREYPHCGLAAGGATTLSAISSQVLIWPLMGLDELEGFIILRERNPQDWKSWKDQSSSSNSFFFPSVHLSVSISSALAPSL